MHGSRKEVIKNTFAAIIGFSLLLEVTIPVCAYERKTHEEIGTTAADRSSLDSTLKSQYGVESGIKLSVNGLEIREWIGAGGNQEDSPPHRVVNHFHDPLQPWPQAGLSVLGFPLRQSSIYWQQNADQGFFFGGTWSWPTARTRFFDFLSKPSKAERDTALADTARALGQVMHMIQDATVPAHTRNDQHLISLDDDGYEKRIEEIRSDAALRSIFDNLLTLAPIFPSPSIFTPTGDSLAPVPIARLIDTDRYLRTNPEILTGTSIGLAEYTNGNFFSDDTVFKEFPFPATTSVDLGNEEPEPVAGGKRRYFKKVRDGELIDHLAVPSALYESLPAALRDEKIGLDSKVLDDYARLLLPRAVGYSAALINYFFRGTLDFEVEDNPADPTQSKITITNTSAEMMDGEFILYADDANGIRTLLVTFNLSLAPGEQSTPQTFLPASNPSEYILVFKGQLGEEKPGSGFIGAIVAKTKKVSETIITVAGTGISGFSGDGGPAVAAKLNGPRRVAVGPDGSLYIADTFNHRIRRVGPDKIITTVAGTGTADFSGDGGAATAAQLNFPVGVALGTDGSLYICDVFNNRIRRLFPDGLIITVAGRGARSPLPDGVSLPPIGDGGQATSAYLSFPSDVTFGSEGSLYIADTNNNRIRRVDVNGVITTVAGTETFGFSGDGGPATAAQLTFPLGVSVGLDGNIYIADIGNNRIRRVGPDGVITTVAGIGTRGYSGDEGPATSAQLNSPQEVVVGPDNSLYIADTNNNRIRRVGSDGIIHTIVGTGISGYSGDGGSPTAARLRFPFGVTLGPDGSLYIADTNNNRIRRIGR